MSIIKSYYVDRGKEIRGDMFYIQHNSKNFTLIDCCLRNTDERRDRIIEEIQKMSKGRVCRFISTHPHEDHICGIEYLNKKWPITNFYAVANNRTGDDDSFKAYIEIKEKHNYPLKRGISRKWLNERNEDNDSSGIFILWPVLSNQESQMALKNCQDDPNQISAVIDYHTNNFRIIWMGDMETAMQEVFYKEVGHELSKVDVLFLPHHGRSSAKLPENLLKKLDPRLIIVGAAPAAEIDYNYYDQSKTLTQNTAKDFILDMHESEINVYTEDDIDNVPDCLVNNNYGNNYGMHYQGTLKTRG